LSGPLGLLYDVHGNLPALEAVLEDAQTQGVRRFLLGGDFTLFGPYPEETIKRLRSLGAAVWIRGNCERLTAAPDDAPDHAKAPVEAVRRALGPKLVRELAELPHQTLIDGRRYCHASPLSDEISFMPEPDGAAQEAEWLAGAEEHAVVFGHTHLPFRRTIAGGETELVNPGSVGLPFDGDQRAAWAILHEDGTFEHRRCGYDHEAAAAASRERHPGFGETIARRIEGAVFAV
jgi:predicted phosphodiesterase